MEHGSTELRDLILNVSELSPFLIVSKFDYTKHYSLGAHNAQ